KRTIPARQARCKRRSSLHDLTFPDVTSRAAGPRWRLMVLLMLLVATGHFNRISMSVAGAERLIKHHVIEETQMGWVYTAYLIVYTLCMTPGGLFIDRFGPKRALLVVLGGSAVFTALTGLSGLLFAAPAALWVALLAVRSVMGLCNAPQHPGAAHL